VTYIVSAMIAAKTPNVQELPLGRNGLRPRRLGAVRATAASATAATGIAWRGFMSGLPRCGASRAMRSAISSNWLARRAYTYAIPQATRNCDSANTSPTLIGPHSFTRYSSGKYPAPIGKRK
jgi:hypothetical protein